MARILIKVEKDDVKTSKLGNNIMVQCDNNIDLIFTPEALQELIDDYNNIISDKKPSDVSSSFTRDDIDSLGREEYRVAQQFAIDFAKWVNFEGIDMISTDTWHHPYKDHNVEINSKELFELFLEHYHRCSRIWS